MNISRKIAGKQKSPIKFHPPMGEIIIIIIITLIIIITIGVYCYTKKYYNRYSNGNQRKSNT